MPDYLITVKAGSNEAAEITVERLVNAKNEAAALKYVVSDTITVSRATIADAVRLGAEGVEVESAA